MLPAGGGGKPQVFLFSAFGIKEKKTKPEAERIRGALAADGYWISREAAELLVRVNDPVVTYSDHWTRYVKRYGLELYRVWPTTVWQNDKVYGTDINIGKIGYHGFGKLVHKACRVPELLLDWLLFKLTGK